MPRKTTSNDKHERQYEHIKTSAAGRGESPKKAKQIAASTVDQSRSEAGESRAAGSRTTATGRRGGTGGRQK